ncbi:MAG: dienelactone hydrolase family protein [Verrucomicrobia bacterium]|nr:dienelactone hydrolase family protein [Verrucomicrobiota bacterium]
MICPIARGAWSRIGVLAGWSALGLFAQTDGALPGTSALVDSGDFSARMVAGIDRFLDQQTELAARDRAVFWERDPASGEIRAQTIARNRERLRTIIGAVDRREPVNVLELASDTSHAARLADHPAYEVFAVRWPVFDGVFGEGLLLQPKGTAVANVVVVPDADQPPEILTGLAAGLPGSNQIARRLAERGCRVIVPTLVSREATWSGIPGKPTNLPHREWIYRQAYEVGRHIVGYEVQKVLAAVDWLERQGGPIGVAGYGEGGLLAFYAAALDQRVQATLVSGYFDARERLWREPIYRNVVSLLREFGDAEIAALIAPRAFVVEHSVAPRVDGPPAPGGGRRNIAAPGRIATPELASVRLEFERAKSLLGEKLAARCEFVADAAGPWANPFSEPAQRAFMAALGLSGASSAPSGDVSILGAVEVAGRQRRAVKQLENHTQHLVQRSEGRRLETFWNPIKAASVAEWEQPLPELKRRFWEEVIGKFPVPTLPANPRARRVTATEKFTSYEVVLDVWPGVFAWGLLQVPNDLRPGERRPVVVCQHGLEGLPADCVTQDATTRAFQAYQGFAATLAERGFITFAPHNPYRGQDAFRVLQRKANPLGKSLFSIILAQHERILDWLDELPFVDAGRIAFYGLSYGGKTAMRVPAVLDRYCLSICSGDFNEWVRKNAATDYPGSYLFAPEYEIFEWDLGHTFNYAEMAALIAPRPFMVERGHRDGVGTDEWVAYEFAKVRRFYTRLGIADRAEIEFFDGPHTINGRGTFEFLHRHLRWPARSAR